MLYAKSTNGFYDRRIHGDNIPSDAVEISQDLYVLLMAGQSNGQEIVGDDDGFPILVDRPIPDPVEPEYFTYKSDIWQRCTEAEAETLDGQLEQAPAKQRRMWNDAITIEHSSESFPLLRENMIAEFGEARTDEILAPSNGG